MQTVQQPVSIRQNIFSLTGREKEILVWLKNGKSTRDIAFILGISSNTVNAHVKNILHKLRVKKRIDAVVLALRNRMIEL